MGQQVMPQTKLRALAASHTPAELLASIDEEQDRLFRLLSGKDESLLAQRPANGDWSVLENVRHLLFSHGTLLRDAGLESGPRANARPGAPDYKLGGTSESSVEEILEMWQSAQSRAQVMAGRDTELVRWALAVVLRHVRNHITVIERLLRAQDRARRRTSP
jgi:hypothetical protein